MEEMCEFCGEPFTLPANLRVNLIKCDICMELRIICDACYKHDNFDCVTCTEGE